MAPNQLVGHRYVRSVTFLDASTDDGKQPPLHVASELLLDDEPTSARVNLALGFSIFGGSDQGTIVAFCVHPEDVVSPEVDADGEVAQWPMLAGRAILVPDGHDWETVHCRSRFAPVGDWVRVYMYVRQAKALAAPTPVEEAS